MKTFFLAAAIGLSIAALAATQQTRKKSSSRQHNNYTLAVFQDTVPKRDTGKWPKKDTMSRRHPDSLNLR